MNMNESDFELEMRELRPAPPSDRLGTAIARELGNSRALATRPTSGVVVRTQVRRAGFWNGLAWAVGGAALAVACFSLFLPEARPVLEAGRNAAAPGGLAEPEATETYFEPTESATELVFADESGVFYDGEDGPSQMVRYSSIERHRWTNPSTGALVELEVPREDILLVPVSYQ
jgi:hypothetical protein